MKNVLKITVLGCLLLSGYAVKGSNVPADCMKVQYAGKEYYIEKKYKSDFLSLTASLTLDPENADYKEQMAIILHPLIKTPPPVAPKPVKKVGNHEQTPCSSSCPSSSCTAYSSSSSSSSLRPSRSTFPTDAEMEGKINGLQDAINAKQMILNRTEDASERAMVLNGLAPLWRALQEVQEAQQVVRLKRQQEAAGDLVTDVALSEMMAEQSLHDLQQQIAQEGVTEERLKDLFNAYEQVQLKDILLSEAVGIYALTEIEKEAFEAALVENLAVDQAAPLIRAILLQ